MNEIWSKIQVIVLTYNEANKLGRGLASLPAGTAVLIVDSGSTDDTIAIAEEFCNRLDITLVEHSFDNYSAQRNFALGMAVRPWALMLDADEVLSQELIDEIAQSLCDDDSDDRVVLAFPWKNYLRDEVIPNGKDYHARLFKVASYRYKGSIHETLDPEPVHVIYTKHYVHHYTYDSIQDYAKKVLVYSYAVAKDSENAKITLRDYLRPIYSFIHIGLFQRALFGTNEQRAHTILMSFYHCLILLFRVERKFEKLRARGE